MNKEGMRILDSFKKNMASNINDNVKTIVNKSDFDKTYIGFVSEKIEKADGTYRWRIQTNGVAYDIKPEMCNITDVGQKVRLFVPNHHYADKYAEVIEDKNTVYCTGIDVNDSNLVFKYEDDSSYTVAITRDDSMRVTSFTVDDMTIEVNWNVSEN